MVPAALADAVGREGFVSQRLDLDIEGQGERLYLVFGRQIAQRWGNLQVYYFFPLDQEVGAAGLVRNTIAITGLALVLMLALVAALVTRMVVNPVRVAARTAQRLSNGLLDQRIEVKGEDDLAALAASFNHMAENLQRHILRLEEMSRLQRRFTSDVSHELRTPLTTVRMAADLIFTEREKFDPPVARSAELLQAELNRFEGLLSELLEISRFDAGFAVLDAEPANLGPLVSRVIDRLAPVAVRAGVTLEFDLPKEPIVAEVDVRRVERILRNLIGNAIEHGDGKPVKVRLAERAGAVAVTVRDHGVGLKPGEDKLVFNRFWRADPSRARHTGGTGLGLSISVEDARLHGGWLEAWGEPGQGAQFRLTLPVKAGDRLVSSPLRLVPGDFRPPRDVGRRCGGYPCRRRPSRSQHRPVTAPEPVRGARPGGSSDPSPRSRSEVCRRSSQSLLKDRSRRPRERSRGAGPMRDRVRGAPTSGCAVVAAAALVAGLVLAGCGVSSQPEPVRVGDGIAAGGGGGGKVQPPSPNTASNPESLVRLFFKASAGGGHGRRGRTCGSSSRPRRRSRGPRTKAQQLTVVRLLSVSAGCCRWPDRGDGDLSDDRCPYRTGQHH